VRVPDGQIAVRFQERDRAPPHLQFAVKDFKNALERDAQIERRSQRLADLQQG